MITIVTAQEFVYQSQNPFQIRPFSDDSGRATMKTYFADRDQDGDLDLFHFSFDFDTTGVFTVFHMVYFVDYQENIGTPTNPVFAPREMAFEDFWYPYGTFFPSMGDLNGDGFLDIVAASQIDSVTEAQRLVFYMNTGSPEGNFEIILSDYFDLSPLMPRSMIMPEMADFDMDGDLDVMLSTLTPRNLEFAEYEDVVFYAKNTGTAFEPEYLGWFDQPYGLVQDSIFEVYKAGDIDHDGDMDLISIAAGQDTMTPIRFYRNTPGTNGKPAYEAKIESPFGLPEPMTGSIFADLNLVDIDGDEDLDVFLLMINGAGESSLLYYRNNACIPHEAQLDEEICEGESVTIAGTEYADAGTYTILLTSQDGCDSIIHLTLDVLPVYEVFLSEAICEGDVYIIDGQQFAMTGDYSVPLLSIEGCDSIIHLQLLVFPVYEEFLSEALCEGDVYVIGGQEFTSTGTYQVMLTSTDGCDSMIIAELQFHSVDISVTQSGELLSANLIGATYQWIDCNTGLDIPGATSQVFEPEVSGSYAVLITGQADCQGTSACFTVVVTNVLEGHLAEAVRIYPNPATTQLWIDNASEFLVTGYRIYAQSGQLLQSTAVPESHRISLLNLTNGIYLLEIKVGEHSVLHKFAVIRP